MSARASAIVVTQEAARARPILAALAAQTVARDLEVVIAAPTAEHEALGAAAGTGFAAVVLLGADPLGAETLPETRRRAVLAARTPVILPTETHCLPEPGWAAGLLAAFDAGADAAYPVMRNLNPRPSFSAAQFAAHFGAWSSRAQLGDASAPRHNTAFRRSVLAGCGDDLRRLLDDEGELQRVLMTAGVRFTPAPAARAWHVNASTPGAACSHAWCGGRRYGARRSAGWSRGRRLAFAAASPLIPLRRLPRELPAARWDGRRRTPAALAAMLAILIVHSAAEAAGALAGEGEATAGRYAVAELRRDEGLAGRDHGGRRLLEAVAA